MTHHYPIIYRNLRCCCCCCCCCNERSKNDDDASACMWSPNTVKSIKSTYGPAGTAVYIYHTSAAVAGYVPRDPGFPPAARWLYYTYDFVITVTTMVVPGFRSGLYLQPCWRLFPHGKNRLMNRDQVKSSSGATRPRGDHLDPNQC